jgi:hypothetical protein
MMFESRPSENRGRRESRVLDTPAASRAKCKAHEFVTTGTPERSGFPRAVVLTVSFVLSQVIGLCCHLDRHDAEASMPKMPASRHQDHTTSPSASMRFVLPHRERPSHPASNVRDDRDTPLLVGAGWASF